MIERSERRAFTVRVLAWMLPLLAAFPLVAEPHRCAAPQPPLITWFGSQGCRPGTPCQVGEMITFKAVPAAGDGYTACETLYWTFSDGMKLTARTPARFFINPGSQSVTVQVSNPSGMAVGTANLIIQPGCALPPPPATQVSIDFLGQQSGCTPWNGARCSTGEVISFQARLWSAQLQPCDVVEWNFGDNSPPARGITVSHVYRSGNNAQVTLRISNPHSETTVTQGLALDGGSPTVVPVIHSFTASATTVKLGEPVTLTWSTTNTTSVRLEPGWPPGLPTSGSVTFTPHKSQRITLVAYYNSIQAARSLFITVVHPRHRAARK